MMLREAISRRIARLLLLAGFFAIATGLTSLAHSEQHHGDHDAAHCQICFLLTSVSSALALTAIYLFFTPKIPVLRPIFAETPRTSRLRRQPSAPRAPPR